MRAAEQLDAVVVAKPLAERSTSVEAVQGPDPSIQDDMGPRGGELGPGSQYTDEEYDREVSRIEEGLQTGCWQPEPRHLKGHDTRPYRNFPFTTRPQGATKSRAFRRKNTD